MDKLGKRLLAVLLTALLLFGGMGALGTMPAAAAQSGDDGTTNWNFIVPVAHQQTVPAGYIGIYDAAGLNNIRNNLVGKYILMKDIDLAGWGNWEPIGNVAANSNTFEGIFDGNGYAISNLSIAISNEDGNRYAGLFGIVYEAQVKNVGLVNVTISNDCLAEGKYSRSVGGIAGVMYRNSLIDNCFVDGDIFSASLAITGGVAGSVSSRGTISNSYHEGKVSGTAWVGGVVGYGDDYTVIEGCYNAGEVSASSSSGVYVGGILGYWCQKIERCYNLATVYGYSGDYVASVGGIAGSANLYSRIENCYNTGELVGAGKTARVGGITGESYDIYRCYNSGTVNGDNALNFGGGGITCMKINGQSFSYCYYLDVVAEHAAAGDNGYANARLSNTQMNQQASFVGFDFASIWQMPAGGGYPVLRGMPGSGTTEPTTYTITFNANGGSGAPTSQIKTQGVALTLSSQIPFREGYTFRGWASSSTATAAQWQPGGSYAVDGNATLWAVWEQSTTTGENAIPIAKADGLVVVDSITVNGKTTNAYYFNSDRLQSWHDNDNVSLQSFTGKYIDKTLTNRNVDTFGLSCASLVKRFYWRQYGVTVRNLFANATPSANSGSFRRLDNATEQPQIGDVVRVSNYPHWALVKAIDGGKITIIEQNYPNKGEARLDHVLTESEKVIFRYVPNTTRTVLEDAESGASVVGNAANIPAGTTLKVEAKARSVFEEIRLFTQ